MKVIACAIFARHGDFRLLAPFSRKRCKLASFEASQMQRTKTPSAHDIAVTTGAPIDSISRATQRYRYDGPMTGTFPFATDARHAVSKRSVKNRGVGFVTCRPKSYESRKVGPKRQRRKPGWSGREEVKSHSRPSPLAQSKLRGRENMEIRGARFEVFEPSVRNFAEE